MFDPRTCMTRRRFMAQTGAATAAAALAGAACAREAGATRAHEADFYEKLPDGRVKCLLCPRACEVGKGERGHCEVRENRDGTYVSLVYGRPVSINLDPIEKKPLFHVYPGSKAYSLATVGCNIDCRFCQNWEISQARPEQFDVPYTPPENVARAAAERQAKTIAYTYTEPTVFCEYVIDCAKAGRERGVGSVMISNGFITERAQKKLFPLMTAIKVDLKSFTQSFYEEVCAGELQPVLDSLKRIRGAGVWLEIVNLLIPTLNDGADDLKRMAAWIVKELGPDVPVHFTRYHPCYKIRNIAPTPPQTLLKARTLALAEGCRYVYTGNLPGVEGENTFCPSCKTAVVNRYGFSVENAFKGACPKCGARIPGVWT